ncbi:pyridine nucleotide-disulfide oxidoreductase [Sphingobacterium faecium NBRC 15299]|uniref:YpdA family putative bacillithiol disulfide reductase n=1 Tax=Sphingobacterium faecium TaxID=34087 RepID=UPI000D363B91|nr:YpdA family putative bacillithiol disulfide reductase [Sphingobacterium faecium]MQP28091.1 YpdA family putative bacillithiol disulfide reductase [Sphingobacterium faecium]PTX13315.1 thioredoxin reductase (NADPH) [Sphingobacterium faecium]GEM66270.1 pyridine nucleotide-disulfide oxidoreductase [Sphingobacterium faecium NBRC 15299]
MQDNYFDIIIVGGGPIGLACALEASLNNLSYLILEKGCLVNSLYHYPQNMTFFSSSDRLEIGDIPFVTTLPKPKRSEALEYYRRIQQKFKLKINLFEEVTAIDKTEFGFHTQTIKNSYTSKYVIIATGFYDIPMELHIPGEELDKVKHYYEDPHYYVNQKVIVVGASNSSIDAALETFRKGADVTLVIRGEEISPRVKYWVKPDIENRIAAGEIRVLYKSTLTKVTQSHAYIHTPNGEIILENDFVLALTGYQPNFKFLKSVGIHISEEAPCIPEHDPATMETNIKGLYLAGVVCGGLNTHLWFIENSRIHAEQIITAIKQEHQ